MKSQWLRLNYTHAYNPDTGNTAPLFAGFVYVEYHHNTDTMDYFGRLTLVPRPKKESEQNGGYTEDSYIPTAAYL
jgi:hypothetical protein